MYQFLFRYVNAKSSTFDVFQGFLKILSLSSSVGLKNNQLSPAHMYQRNRLQHGDNFPLNMTISFFTTRKHVLGVFLTLFFICIIYYRVIQFVLLFMHNGRHFDLLFFVTEMCGPNKYFSSLILDRIQHSQPIGSYYKCPCIARRSPKKSLFSDTVGYPLVPFLFYLNYNMPIYAKR